MTLFVSVSLAICFSVGLILSSTLTYLETQNYFRPKSHVCKYDYRWEKIAGIVVAIGSIGLGITGLVAITTAPHSTQGQYNWLDAVIMCNLQLHASNNLVRLLQNFNSPPWAIWAIHLVAILTILDIVSAVSARTTSSAYESALLARLAAASLLSSALSRKRLETHKNLGFEGRDEEFVQMLLKNGNPSGGGGDCGETAAVYKHAAVKKELIKQD
ncbi:hypothetical protein L13192_07137 [Pyrenophora tritici-repentis]|nr:hypothetical protein L13192_07137 [Pyrenophora tritici-repentis]